MTIERLGIVGGGQMGAGIGEVAAKAGIDVVIVEAAAEIAEKSQGRISASLEKAVSREKISRADADATLARLQFSTEPGELADRQFVIEAIVENLALKEDLFAKLDSIVTDPDAILASNTSSIPIIKLAAQTNRPDKVIGTHFFNPVPVMALLELVQSLKTSEETVERARSLGEQLGKQMILSKDRAGFIVNYLLVPYIVNAIKMFEEGFASAEDIDNGMKLGANHPMGPLELADFIGLDTMLFVQEVLYAEFADPFYAAPPLLRRMVDAGLLGRKTGEGFYRY
ncbi:MAG: 3-hydroxybutyryl-CoA dehydrogenase [Acidimicrobiia bacterium]|nr:3-hydroxybutyryl-CoA dehydrogenase [Acidimicrobiia bacterium]MBT8251033.1 3-hydroxybutyryl-CoA dehydrogenase [Acidimicrobiia bacterium]NNC42674.1 3-hydroxybutyryl-CoA dehydrogenase [Acidimicrobiia bacterium]NND13253.1 3-hydroxybutyryl-CoA dehydrogenase [Acidimicrobiia bacterium]NNL29199.1 3-hydroxybutyryl-CoA dehydrogenase [Acidimicrobiia bacterium]